MEGGETFFKLSHLGRSSRGDGSDGVGVDHELGTSINQTVDV
jgi:hypothetical protein